MTEIGIRNEIMIQSLLWIRDNFPEQIKRMDFDNIVEISIDDIVSEIILYGCWSAYHETSEKYSVRHHLSKMNMDDDANRVRIQRTVARINDNRIERYKAWKELYGESVDALLPKDMNGIEKKLEGYEFNDFQFWEIMDTADSKFQEWIYQDRINKKGNSNEDFRLEATAYDEKIARFLSTIENGTEQDRLFAYMVLYILEREYDIEFDYEIARELETRKITPDKDLYHRTQYFRQSIPEFVLPSLGLSEVECSLMPAHSQLIMTRGKFIESIINLKTPDEFERVMLQYFATVGLILNLFRYMPFHGTNLFSWFVHNTDISDWLFLYENSNLVNLFDTEKEWPNKRIRVFKNLHSAPSSKNPKKRS